MHESICRRRVMRACSDVRPPASGASLDVLDAWYMRRCVSLATRAVGQTRPNPVVGCVLVNKGGEIIGEGYHTRAGRAHAEVEALTAAGGRETAGCTAYVSLEPCSHVGKTGPCVEALIAARVSRVVVGLIDPFPAVAGSGVKRLREASIRVDVGVEGALCEETNAGFLHRVKFGCPMGTLKYAMTIDGKIATRTLSSRWVTGEAARSRVQKIRAATDAIVVGARTVRLDDPRLTVRDGRALDDRIAPYRVVMSRTLDLPLDAALWRRQTDQLAGQPVVLVDKKHGRPHMVSELRARDVLVHEVAGLRASDAMRVLHSLDCVNVLWECGGTLAREAISEGCVQKVCAFIAPKLVGGREAPTPVDGDSLCEKMSNAIEMKNSVVEMLGDDILVMGNI